jgi:hypothetical protein
MADDGPDLEHVHAVIDDLTKIGFEPILVGGMALVALGSQRVTRDFDFVIAAPGDRLTLLVDTFYDRGWELVSRLNRAGQVTATIDNRRIAAMRIRLDGPYSVYFFHKSARVRIDLLFDFPVPAARLARSAARFKVQSHEFAIASEADLLELKRIAQRGRAKPGDAEDIAFLEARRASQRGGARRKPS